MKTKEGPYGIYLGKIHFLYFLSKNRRTKNFRITLYGDGHCVVSIPYGYGRPSAEKFLLERSEWIQNCLSQRKSKQKILSGYYDREEYLAYKEKAYAFVLKEIKECNAYYGFSYSRVRIRNQRSRWGSCSSSKTLSFHYKILFLPLNLAHYLIVHELCHLQEMNHSKRFWELVSKTYPDYKEVRKELLLW